MLFQHHHVDGPIRFFILHHGMIFAKNLEWSKNIQSSNFSFLILKQFFKNL